MAVSTPQEGSRDIALCTPENELQGAIIVKLAEQGMAGERPRRSMSAHDIHGCEIGRTGDGVGRAKTLDQVHTVPRPIHGRSPTTSRNFDEVCAYPSES